MDHPNDPAHYDTLATLLRERGWTVLPPGTSPVPASSSGLDPALQEPANTVTWSRRAKDMLTLYYRRKYDEPTGWQNPSGGPFDRGKVSFAEIASDMIHDPVDFRRVRNIGPAPIREVFKRLAERGFAIPEETRRRSGIGLK